ncbi:MAG: HAD-IA family hydrolase, partial [Anaerolineales bacterium]
MTERVPISRQSSLWRDCDTVLLDMDVTLLDLSFDNWFWREAVPRCLARVQGEPADEIRVRLFEKFARKQGSLDWYCLDYWTAELGLDLRALKIASSHRIRYLPGAREFLRRAVTTGKRLVLVTNAHGDALEVKKGVAGLGRFFEACITSHEFGVPKETADFWPQLRDRLGFEADRTLLVDDSLPVLDAAAEYGIAAVVAITRPDTRQPPRQMQRHHAVEGVASLMNI